MMKNKSTILFYSVPDVNINPTEQNDIPIYICLSKRPGLSSAGSRMSGLFVPARTTTLVAVLNPIIRGKKKDNAQPLNTL